MANENDQLKAFKSGQEIESPSFDITFQMAVLHLAMEEDYFCGQLCKYLGNDKDLDEYSIFDSPELQHIFKLMNESMKEFRQRPSEGQLRQKFMQVDEPRRSELNQALDALLGTVINDDNFYRAYLQTYIQQVKFAKGYKKTKNIFSKHAMEAPKFMQQVLDDLRRVSFDKEDIVSMDDLPFLISESIKSNSAKIPTGIKELDEDLVGGLPRENLTVVLAGTNVGKSLFCISLAANALRMRQPDGSDANFKVLHINLEGQRDESLKRYAANLAAINYNELIKGSYSDDARRRLEDMQIRYSPDRLLIRNMLGFGATIEQLVAFCREIYKDFKFDMLVVDYGQLLETEAKTEGYRFTMSKVFRGLDSISKEFKCVVVTPAQATRGAQTKQNENNRFSKQEDRAPILRSEDISEAFEIARVSGVILTLNLTEEEGKKGKLRLFLEKQRQGAKNKLYGLYTNYSQANLITGKTYDPFETVITGDGNINKTEQIIKNRQAAGLTGTFKPQELPKPKPVAEAKETADAQKVSSDTSFIAKEEISTMSPTEEEIDNNCNQFLEFRQKYMQIKTAYEDMKEDDTADRDEMDKMRSQLETIRNHLFELQKEVRTMIPQAYETANKEMLDLTKKSLNDLKLNDSANKDIIKLERIVKHLEIGLDVVKIPST